MYKNKINKIDISDPYWPFLISHKIVQQELALTSCPLPSAVFHHGAGSAEPGSGGFVLSALALCQLHQSRGQKAEIRVFWSQVVGCGIPLMPLLRTSSMPRSHGEPVPALALSPVQVPLTFIQGSARDQVLGCDLLQDDLPEKPCSQQGPTPRLPLLPGLRSPWEELPHHRRVSPPAASPEPHQCSL